MRLRITSKLSHWSEYYATRAEGLLRVEALVFFPDILQVVIEKREEGVN
jgi:hypothetical protein